MPKGTTSRVRSRKINFKTRISVLKGSTSFEHGAHDGSFAGTDGIVALGHGGGGAGGGVTGGLEAHGGHHDGDPEGEGNARMETGVDKEEEHEHHLQVAISASAASLLRSGNASTSKAPAPAVYIPTPDAAGTVADYASLYKSGVFAEPKGYIRFSDTLEETQDQTYTMDEDDDEWLQAWNKQYGTSGAGEDEKGGGQSPRKNGLHVNGANGEGAVRGSGRSSPRKGKEVALGPMSEDDFEAVMGALEKACEEVSPLLHLNLDNFPTITDLETKSGEITPNLRALARVVYPHWKERRIERDGKSINPQLDIRSLIPQDTETGEVSPYICFRRRELKTVRKTRRNDVQNLERLAKLRNDLLFAKTLLEKVVEREQLKTETYTTEQNIFEGRATLRDLKRKAGDGTGDEELLIGKKEKRKDKREGKEHGSSIKLSLRKSGANSLPLQPLSIAEQYAAYRQVQETIANRVERDLARKREADAGCEDFTDTAYLPFPALAGTKHWKAPEFFPLTPENGERSYTRYFPPYFAAHSGGLRDTYRKRVGRGGRIILDRIRTRAATSQLRKEAEDADPDSEMARAWDRWKFDSDVVNDFPLTEPAIVDDFAVPFASRRLGLLQPKDYDFLEVDGHHLEEATAYALKEPEKPPPVTFVPSKIMARLPVQGAGVGAGGFQTPLGVGAFPPGSAGAQHAVAGQMVAAANHANVLAAAQATMRQQAARQNGTIIAAPGLQRTPSSSQANMAAAAAAQAQVQQQQQQQQQQQNPAAWAGANNYLAALGGAPNMAFPNGLLQQFPASALQQGFQNVGIARTLQNGMPAVGSQAMVNMAIAAQVSAANGVNGIQTPTSRIANPGFPAPVTMQQQMRPQPQPQDVLGSPGLGSAASRPGSSASGATHSPAMGQAQLAAAQGGTPAMRKRSLAPGQLNLGMANQQFVNQQSAVAMANGVNGMQNGAFLQLQQQQQAAQQAAAAQQQR